MTKLYDRIKMILKSGAVLCDRQYSFLAFSSSQLREHSCWMFHSHQNSDTTANSIRTWMGDFRNIRPVAKFAARVSENSIFRDHF
jgi:RNA-dependent RNA polymerase